MKSDKNQPSGKREKISEATEAGGHLHRAEALFAQGDWDGALELYTRAAEQQPDHGDILLGLAQVQIHLKLYNDAAQSLVQAIRLQPDKPELHQALAELQYLCEDFEGAAESYKLADTLRRSGGTALPLPPGPQVAEAYLDLLKDSLTYMLWEARDGPILELQPKRVVASLVRLFQSLSHRIRPNQAVRRELGMDWPRTALTMVGRRRLDNLQQCIEVVLRENIAGDLLEAGVWRGGATIFMRGVLRAYGDSLRTVWVADSFSGLPEPRPDIYPADRDYDLSMWKSLSVSADTVRGNFRRFGLLDHQVKFIEGWFSDSLPASSVQQLSLLRLDGDLYQSTMDTLVPMYPKVSSGGFVIIDDYFSAPPCRAAVDDYRKQHQVTEPIIGIDGSGAYWRRG